MGPKIPYLGLFDPKCLIWVFLGRILKKTIVIFEISTFKFVWLQNFAKKQKCRNLGPKLPYLGIFWARILENYCHIWNQDLRICLIGKSGEETKILKFGAKNTLFGYFWPKMPYLNIFGLELKNKKLLSYLKSAPSNLPICKIS